MASRRRVTAAEGLPFGEPCRGRTPGCGDQSCSITFGECHCSPDCHELVAIAPYNRHERDWVVGWPLRYANGHAATLAGKARAAKRATGRLRTVREGPYGSTQFVVGTSCSVCGHELPVRAFKAGDPFCSRTCFERSLGIETSKREGAYNIGGPPSDYRPVFTRRQIEALQRDKEARENFRSSKGRKYETLPLADENALSPEERLLGAVVRMWQERPEFVMRVWARDEAARRRSGETGQESFRAGRFPLANVRESAYHAACPTRR
jgi:hypothetical protein